MLDIEPRILEQILVILHNDLPPNTKIYAFGSRTKNKARKYSDLDLAFLGTEKIPLSIMTKLNFALMESSIPIKVDIIDLNNISDNFKQNIEKDLVLINNN